MNNFLISYGTYYSYLEKSIQSHFSESHKCDVQIDTFLNGEISVKFQESLRGKHLFIFGETSLNLTELLLTIDAAKRSSVKEMTVVLPYYGYSRQDKRESTRGCIGAKVVANVLESAGVHRIISIDLHAEQIQGFFQIPFEKINGRHIFQKWIEEKINSNLRRSISVLCSPDAGGVGRVMKYSNELGLPLVTINKRRDRPGHVSSMELTGNVEGRDVYLIDDIVDSGGTLIKANQYLKEKGAKNVYNIITHPILSNHAEEKLVESGVILITTDTRNVSQFKNDEMYSNFIQILNCGSIIAETITRIANEESISTLS